MTKYDIKINLKELNNIINKISKDINDLEYEMNNVNDAYLSLDETKWKGKDKSKVDSSLGIYLKDMTNFSTNLRNTLDVLKQGYNNYENSIQDEKKYLQDLEDL